MALCFGAAGSPEGTPSGKLRLVSHRLAKCIACALSALWRSSVAAPNESWSMLLQAKVVCAKLEYAKVMSLCRAPLDWSKFRLDWRSTK